MKRLLRILFFVTLSVLQLFLLRERPVRASGSAKTAPPLQVRLEVPLDTRKAATGDPLFASVTVAWNGPDCFLRKGATVSGRVLELQSHGRGAPTSEVTLLFDRADCYGQRGVPVQLILYAVVSTQDAPPMEEQGGMIGNGNPSNPHFGGGSAGGGSMTRNQAMVDDLNSFSQAQGGGTTAVKAGEVSGIPDVTMSAGIGPQESSVLHSKKRDFRVGTGTLLVLVSHPRPRPATEPVEERSAAKIPVKAAAAPVAPPVDETEICAADCSSTSLSDDASAKQSEGASEASISLARFGFQPRRRPRLDTLRHDGSLAYLGTGEILVTFDINGLRRHTGLDWRPSVRRTVRALLLNPAGTVTRVMDWQVAGEGQYLWAAGPRRVIVNMAGGLRLLGPGLQTVRSLPGRGELVWVSVSPAGDHIVYGLRRERHTEQVHKKIAALAGTEPEEDLEVHSLDLTTGDDRSELLGDRTTAPLLTDRGFLSVRSDGGRRWKIQEELWGGDRSTMAVVNSACSPEISPARDNMVFVMGCAADAAGPRWYRVLRENGRTVLKSRPSSQEFAQAIDTAGPVFAIRIVQTSRPFTEGFSLHAEELVGETVAVYRQTDGKQVLLERVRDLCQCNESFALSPDGKDLALLSAGEVSLYSVGEAH